MLERTAATTALVPVETDWQICFGQVTGLVRSWGDVNLTSSVCVIEMSFRKVAER